MPAGLVLWAVLERRNGGEQRVLCAAKTVSEEEEVERQSLQGTKTKGLRPRPHARRVRVCSLPLRSPQALGTRHRSFFFRLLLLLLRTSLVSPPFAANGAQHCHVTHGARLFETATPTAPSSVQAGQLAHTPVPKDPYSIPTPFTFSFEWNQRRYLNGHRAARLTREERMASELV